MNKENYKKTYYELIPSFKKKGTIEFCNLYFKLTKVINKIIYYYNNDFKLEKKIINFYYKLGFEYKNNTNNVNKFIKYLKTYQLIIIYIINNNFFVHIITTLILE